MPVPERFLIVAGAPKSGTTSVARWLAARPDCVIGARHKEPCFHTDFAERHWEGPAAQAMLRIRERDEVDYLALYDREPRALWAIDASTDYLWCEASPARIAAWAARFQVKVLIILRDPVDRIVSEYAHTLRDELESVGLRRSLELEPERKALGWHPLFYHVTRSRYAGPVAHYRALFGDDLMVARYEDLADREGFLRRLETFLGLPPHDPEVPAQHNASFHYRLPALARAMRRGPLLEAARRVVPKRLRPVVRDGLEGALRTRFAPTEADLEDIRERLAEETLACVRDPDIDTSGWRNALPEPR